MLTSLIFLAFLGPTHAKCIPSDRGDAPGVGIDLTMAYGAVAIHFKNGTTKDAGRIDGTPEYLAAMKSLAEDAQQFHSLRPPEELTYEPTQTFYPPLFIMEWWSSLKAWYTTDDTYSTPDPYLPDKWVEVVADMLSRIKSEILDTFDPPLQYEGVFTTWPDFEANTGSLYSVRFRLACRQAGLEHLDGDIVSYHALQYDGIAGDQWDEGDYETSGPLAMLVVSYNTASLGISLITREAGMLWPRRLVDSPRHRPALSHGSEYWDNVKWLLEDVIQDETVDHILLLGSHAYDADLIQAVDDVIQSHGNINSSILGRYRSGISNMHDENLPVFTAARQAAVVARWIMEANACTSNDQMADHVHLEL
ncbi:hypothetical protein BJX63DRAFT_429395 [Aspergillus granulosus]|uniref:Uncharacterized protein n=1 Tax=Aspergillus granulosus TaxID=176169 RepID=A0ABR4HRH6_9EURO